MKHTPKQELESIRKTLTEFWALLNSQENLAIYQLAHAHGVVLSDDYVKKVTPLNKKLKKFMGIK